MCDIFFRGAWRRQQHHRFLQTLQPRLFPSSRQFREQIMEPYRLCLLPIVEKLELNGAKSYLKVVFSKL